MDPDENEPLFRPELFQMPLFITPKLSIQKLKSSKITQLSHPRMKIKEYLESKEESARLRKHLLNLIEGEKETENDFNLPNNEERRLVRYYHYIQQGVDVTNIAPINRRWLENISNRVPLKIKLNKIALFDQLISEVQNDFLLNVKKSVVDFALQNWEQDFKTNKCQISRFEPKILEQIRKKKKIYDNIKLKIHNNLFKIHPTIVKINQLWFQQYKNVRIVNVSQLHGSEALELSQFSDWLLEQAKEYELTIMEKWIPTVYKIVSNALEKKVIFTINTDKLKVFYRCLFILMSLQLQNVCYKALMEFTEFMCDVSHSPGFQVHVLYKNNKIIFSPSFKDFQKVFLSIFDKCISAVSKVPRIEIKLFIGNSFSTEERYLNPFILPEIIENCRSRINLVLQNAWVCPELKIQDFDEYVCLVNGQCKIELNKFLSEERTFSMFKQKVEWYHDLAYEISLTCSKVETIGMFEMHREHFISILMNKAQATKDRFLNKIIDTYQTACKYLNEEFQDIKDKLLKPPSDTAELVQLKIYCLKLGTEVFFRMEDRLREAMHYILFCSDFVPLKSIEIKQNSITFLCYRRINGILDENRAIIKEKTNVFQDLLVKRIETFMNNLEKYRKDVDEFQNYRDATELPKYLKKAQNLHKKLVTTQEHIREFNEEEIAFGWQLTSYPKRDELVEKLSPYKKLYENCAEYKNKYQVWTETKVGTFEPEQIEKDIENFHHNITELSKEFSSNPAPYALTNSIKLDIEQFQKHMPIIKTLGNPCLKERHWEKISEIVGFPLRMEDDLTLAKILDYGLEEYVPKFHTISSSATKESCLEIKLDSMILEWREVKFEIIPYRNSGTYILTSIDKIQILLDDHIVKTQTMKNSPYIKPFENTIRLWEEKLILLQEIIDSWLVVQKTWLYFEPIFTFSDIQQLIPEESKRFSAVDKVWKDIMKATCVNTSVLVVVGMDKILERFKKCTLLLNMIQNGLHGYLDPKRSIFPRFFFLSNKEILSIISNTRDPRGVQPHLNKCFNGIKKLAFNDDLDVTALVSNMGEELHLIEEVDTGSKRGQVEKWFCDLENVMKNSVKKEIQKAIEEYDEKNLEKWYSSRVQQVILISYEIICTSEIVKRLSSTNLLNEYVGDTSTKLDQLVSLMTANPKQKYICTISNLVMTLIRIRDNVLRIINVEENQRKSEFSMIINYYTNDDEVTLSAFNTSIKYGYEYTGSYSPLVATPTIESSYKSFFLSYKYHFGVLVEGRHGIGKTALVQDFSKRSGRHSVLISCSQIMDYSIFERIFKGAVISDTTWLCFDNLDLVTENGLHIIESYIIRIQQAIQFGDRTVKFNNSNHKIFNHLIFATIDDRRMKILSKIPSLLNTYFRRITIDNYERQQICEWKFRLMGFKNYVCLSDKLETLIKISARLFDSKSYFYNDLRMVNRVFNNLVSLKNSECEIICEESLLCKAIELTCRPSFQADDWLLLKKVVSLLLEDQKSLPLDEHLLSTIREACSNNNIVFDGNIYDKIQQLLNVIDHSVGVVLIGNSFGGKSTLLNILSCVLKYLKNEQIQSAVISPKSVTLEQLFGHQDVATSKWIDGIFSKYYRNFHEMDINVRKWLILDGPMEASWIENLYSVLDDTKKLCLETGETIPLALRTNIIFETITLDTVSPSILSRCSTIFVNTDVLKWEYLIISWLNTLTTSIAENLKKLIHSLALRFCQTLFHFFHEQSCIKSVIHVSKNHMIKTLCDIFDCFLEDYDNDVYMESITEIDLRSQLEGIFFFSCIWSVGALLKQSEKGDFDILFRALQCKEFPKDVQKRFKLPDDLCKSPTKQYVYTIPDFATVFDYQYIKEGKGKWKLWSENITTPSVIPRDLQFGQIMVPTKTTIRNQHLLSLLIRKQKFVLLVGDTASGKSTDINYFLNSKLERSKYKPIFLNFTRGTTGRSVQQLMNCKLEKKKRGVFGPPLGLRFVLFIDDLNSPKTDQYGCNSAIELLRHWIEFKHWYSLDDASLVQIIDVQFICGLTTRFGGNKDDSILSHRFSKYFTILHNDIFDNETIKSIFSKIMLWHLDTRGFSKEFDPCIDQIVDATLSMHRLVQKNLLPVPNKPHYIFNLRDFSRVIQGVVLSVPEAIEDLSAMKRLWVHEVTRIYNDRLIDEDDSDWFLNNLKSVTNEQLKEDLNSLLRHLIDNNEVEATQSTLRKLLFCDFINPKTDIRNYAEVQDMDALQSIVEGYLMEYNNVNKKHMNLLLFSHAIEHISRICRIIKQPQGHALLFGEYGSGKQSLARLAIHMCEYEFFEIELLDSYEETDWKNDLKTLLRTVFTDQHCAFLCSNTQALAPSMLDDVSNLLQFAQVPELFTVEEKNEIYEKMEIVDNQRDKALQTDGSHEALFNLFLQRTKKQIHIVLVVNFSSDDFRQLIYDHPSFINCCTIDWFEPWPLEIQNIVAKKLLQDVKWEYSDLQVVIKSCHKLYLFARKLSAELREKINTNLYFSQKSFMNMITTFKTLFNRKYSELSMLKNFYDKSLQRLSNIREQIPILEYEHQSLQPTIVNKCKEVENSESLIQTEKELETEVEISVNGAKTIVKNCEKKRNIKQTEYDKKIAEIKSTRDNVIEILQTLSSNDIAVLKSMKNPPKPVKLVAEGLVYLKELKTEKIQESGKVVDDFWKSAIKIISDSKFVDMLMNFDPSEVSARILKFLEDRIIYNEDFDAEKIRSFSVAAEGIYEWISVVYEYNKVTKLDSEVRIQLLAAEEELASAIKNLAVKEKHLEEVQTKRKNLENQMLEGKRELKLLENKENLCEKKKMRANEIIRVLNGKKEYWLEKSHLLSEKIRTVLGDSVLCSAILSYLIALPQEIRDSNVMEWHSIISEAGLHCSSSFDISLFLLSEIEVGNLKISKFIEDHSFLQHIAILRNTSKYPLMIDSTGIFTSWIKTNEHQDITIIRMEHEDYQGALEDAITSGNPILLQLVHGPPNPVLYPLFDKENFNSSNNQQVKLGKNSMKLYPNFKLYLSTENQDMDIDFELFERLAIVNCNFSKVSVENDILETIAKKEKPELIDARQQWIAELINLKKVSSAFELKILQILTDSKNILEAETEVNILITNATVINENSKKIFDLNNQIESVNSVILEYRTFSLPFSTLFKTLRELHKLNVKYQFSLKWFENLIINLIDYLGKIETPENKLDRFKETFLQSFYIHVCHSLLDKEKIVFGFLLAFWSQDYVEEEFLFLFKYLKNYMENDNTIDLRTYRLSKLDDFRNIKRFKKMFEDFNIADHIIRESLNEIHIPAEFLQTLGSFQKLVFLVYLFPDKSYTYLQKFITAEFHVTLLDDEQCILHAAYKESKCYIPISLIVLDLFNPTKSLISIAINVGISLEKCFIVTTSQYEDFFSSELISLGKSNGSWFIFLNLQYSNAWFNKIQEIVETLSPTTVHPDFRMWIILQSSLSCPDFILKNTFKIAYKRRPQAITFKSVREELCCRLFCKDNTIQIGTEEKMFEKLICFHNMLLNTNYLLPWISPPEFDDVDLMISFNELHTQNDVVLIKSFFENCCYGNKVRNRWDKMYLLSVVDSVWIESENKSSVSCNLEEKLSNLKMRKRNKLMIEHIVKVFNPEISYKSAISENILQIITDLEEKIPNTISLEHQRREKQTKNVFLTLAIKNEIEYFNKLVDHLRNQLSTLKCSLRGYYWFTDELKILLQDLRTGFINQISTKYPNKLKLSSFSDVLRTKYDFLNKLSSEQLESINMFALEYPQKFMLLVLLQHCSNEDILPNKVDLDSWAYIDSVHCNNTTYWYLASDCFLLSNAFWDENCKKLVLNFNSDQKLPLLTIMPVLKGEIFREEIYYCPCYKQRNNTGEKEDSAPEYIFSIRFPTIHSSLKFIRRRTNIRLVEQTNV